MSLTANTSGFTRGMSNARRDVSAFQSSLSALKRQAATALGAYFGMQGIRSSLANFAAQDKAVRTLSASLDMIGKNSPGSVKGLEQFAGQLQNVSTYGDEAIMEVAALGARLGKFAGNDLKRATASAVGLSKALDVDLDTAMRLIIKAANGNTTALARYGVQLSDTGNTQQRFNEVQEFGLRSLSLAKAETESLGGAMAQLKNDIGDVSEIVGGKLAPTIMKASNIIRTVAIPAIHNYGLAWKLMRAGATMEALKLRDNIRAIIDGDIGGYFNRLPDRAVEGLRGLRERIEGGVRGIAPGAGIGGTVDRAGQIMSPSIYGRGPMPSFPRAYDPSGGAGSHPFRDILGSRAVANVRREFGARAANLTSASRFAAMGLPVALGGLAVGGPVTAGAGTFLGAQALMALGGSLMSPRQPEAASTGIAGGITGGRAAFAGMASGGMRGSIASMLLRGAGGGLVGAVAGVLIDQLPRLLVRKATGGGHGFVGSASPLAAMLASAQGISGMSAVSAPGKYAADTLEAIAAFEELLAEFRKAAERAGPDVPGSDISAASGGVTVPRGVEGLVSNFLTRIPGAGQTDRQILDVNKQQLAVSKSIKQGIDTMNRRTSDPYGAPGVI